VNRTLLDAGAGTVSSASSPAALDDLESRVIISRTHPADYGQRQVFVRLDDRPNIALVFGQSYEQEVRPGHHHMRIHNTLFWKHIDFTIEPGEHLEFIVINSARWWTAGVVGVLGAAPLFLRVERLSLR